MPDLRLDQLLREIRARAHDGAEQGIVLYGHPLPENRGFSTAELIADVRRLQGNLYVADSRRDLDTTISDAGLRGAADAVAILVEVASLTATRDGWSLRTTQFGAKFGLCNDERFHAQPCAGFCSGLLVAPRLLATAAHCIRGLRQKDFDRRLQEIRVVFGFRALPIDLGTIALSRNQVYAPTRLRERAFDTGSGADWAVLELDRDVTVAAPQAVRRTGRVATGAELAVIGHPCGLPAKYAPGGHVRANDQDAFFRADLDAFGGNSGSPVFSADWTVEGLLVRGSPDFVLDGTCRRSLVIPVRDEDGDPPGEDCVRTSLFADHVV